MRRSFWARSFGSIPKDNPATLFIIQSAIPNQGDAWTWVLDNLRRALEDAALEEETGDRSSHTFTLVNDFVAAVGKRLGEMHVALAAETDDPAFAPEVADDEVIAGWTKDAAEQIERSMGELERAKPNLSPERQALAGFRALAQGGSHRRPAGSR